MSNGGAAVSRARRYAKRAGAAQSLLARLFVCLSARSVAGLLACLVACLLACSSENVGGRGHLSAALARDENQKAFAAAARDVLAPHTRFRLGNARETVHMPQPWGISYSSAAAQSHVSARHAWSAIQATKSCQLDQLHEDIYVHATTSNRAH